MMRAEDIEQYIGNALPCQHIRVEGDGQHWQALVVSPEFVGKTRIARHKMVNATVQERLASNEIHALSLKTMTPEEWDAVRG